MLLVSGQGYPVCENETHKRRKVQMKSALKLRSLVVQMALRKSTWKHVQGNRGNSVRHCSLSIKVAGPMPGLGSYADAMFDNEFLEYVPVSTEMEDGILSC